MKNCAITVGERIKLRREELGMSQEQLAKKIGYSTRSTINRIEHDDRKVNQEKILMLANALKVTPAYLMGWVDNSEELFMPATDFDKLEPTERAIMERIQFLSTGNQVAVLSIVNQLIDAQREEKK